MQDITEEATLNRNTFYLHCPDKTVLLQAMTESPFRAPIAHRNISYKDCNGALLAVALGVCDYLVELTNCSIKGGSDSVRRSDHPGNGGHVHGGRLTSRSRHGIDPAMIATGRLGCFGAARRWHQTPPRKWIPAEDRATKIEIMVKPVGLNSFA